MRRGQGEKRTKRTKRTLVIKIELIKVELIKVVVRQWLQSEVNWCKEDMIWCQPPEGETLYDA